MFDLIISGGQICDGSGGKPFIADIGIAGKEIAAVGNLSEADTKERFDASGLTVMPGFIDVHTHSDMALFLDPDRTAPLCQGITTEITGACGLGLFPLPDDRWCELMAGIYGCKARSFRSCAEYLAALPPTGVNAAVQLAHSPLRFSLCGMEDILLPRRKAAELVRQAFEEGACGFSTGLAYFPAAFDDTDTVAELCRTAKDFGVVLSVHQRTAFRGDPGKFDSKEEVLEFARKSGIAVQYSHYRTTPATAGQTRTILEYIERGRAEGLDVTADFYPYPVGAGYAAVNLPFSVMNGTLPEILNKIRKPQVYTAILEKWRSDPKFALKCVLLHAPRHPDYIGKTYAELADLEKKDIPQFLLDLLISEKLEAAYRLETGFSQESLELLELDFLELLKQPWYMLGSDTLPGHQLVHPRSFGAFARMLAIAVRHGFPPETFANRAAGLPAERFHLAGRGFIREHYFADLCVFDPEKVRDTATFEMPVQTAQGMKLVTVNGKIALRDGKTTGIRSGMPLRRGQKQQGRKNGNL